MTYDIKLHRRFWFAKTLKKVKGHSFMAKIDQVGQPLSTPEGMMIIIFEDERRAFINVKNFQMISFSDGWFKIEAENVRKESQGKADIRAEN
ncbi:hypothetical protein KKI24_28895 [bacterium]|nr:hypothetical protein [bacterium]